MNSLKERIINGMNLNEFYTKIKKLWKNNKKVMENYFFMTVLQVLNSLFYLLLYPYLIRVLGNESYGLYVFAWSIVCYFITLVTFGFDMPAVKAIAENQNNKSQKEKILSCIFTAKIYVEVISLFLFVIIISTIPKLRENSVLFFILFAQTVTNIIFPQWYYQGIQRMRIVTVIQLIAKLFSLPFVFWLVKSPEDVNIFAVFMSATSVLGGITAMAMIRFKEKLRIKWQPFTELKNWYKDSLPFFLSHSIGSFKEQSIVVLAGALFGMGEVAIYDLASKIILIPRILFVNINNALFPKYILKNTIQTIKKILKFEILLGITTVLFIVLFGKHAVLLMGGKSMLGAYPVSVILSFTVAVWLVVGVYHYFVFIPQNMYYIITKNQTIALITMFACLAIGFVFAKNIYILAIAIVLSGAAEIIYSLFITSKNKLLKA